MNGTKILFLEPKCEGADVINNYEQITESPILELYLNKYEPWKRKKKLIYAAKFAKLRLPKETLIREIGKFL